MDAISKAQIQGLPEDRLDLLDQYCKAVWDWNQKINLTRHTTYDLFVKRDLLDSWELAKLLAPNEEILDIGTGGGVPGVVVAILRPDVQVSVCDSVGKKAKVIDGIVQSLELPVPVYASSVQDVLKEFTFDSLCARAVGPLARMCGWLNDSWHCFNRLLAIKGPKWIEERGEARHRGLLHNIQLRRLVTYRMPDTNSDSVILQLRRPKPNEAPEVDQD